jgi:flavodoxin
MPQPLFTFLEEYDFSGKTIIPFNSHGGSGFSNTIEEIKEFQPDANISDEGLSISRDKVADSVQDVTDWVKSLDLSEE